MSNILLQNDQESLLHLRTADAIAQELESVLSDIQFGIDKSYLVTRRTKIEGMLTLAKAQKVFSQGNMRCKNDPSYMCGRTGNIHPLALVECIFNEAMATFRHNSYGETCENFQNNLPVHKANLDTLENLIIVQCHDMYSRDRTESLAFLLTLYKCIVLMRFEIVYKLKKSKTGYIFNMNHFNGND